MFPRRVCCGPAVAHTSIFVRSILTDGDIPGSPRVLDSYDSAIHNGRVIGAEELVPLPIDPCWWLGRAFVQIFE